MYVGIAISTLPTGIATVPDKHAHVSYSPLSNTPIYQAVSHTYHSPRSFHSNHKGILDLTKQGNIYHDLVDHPLIGSPIIIHCGGGATFMASVFRWYRTPSGLSWTMFPKKHQHQPDQPVTGSRHRLMRGNHLSSENLQCHSMSLIDW